MSYTRKGGSGKSGTLRQQFNYYKRQLKNRLMHEQAFKLARGVSDESVIKTMFKRLDYEDIMQNGITRKVGNTTIRIKGELAIKIQIESLRQRASKSQQTEIFIRNYQKSLENVGMQQEQVEKIVKKMRSMSSDKITYLVDKGIIKQIAFVYANGEDDMDYVYEEIMDGLRAGIDKEEWKQIQARKKLAYKQEKEKAESGLF